MNKISFIYIFAFFSLILMIITLIKIWKTNSFKNYSKLTLTIITFVVPILGFYMVFIKKNN